MKTAVPLCRNRIAPLFDVADTFLLSEAGQVSPAGPVESVFSINTTCTRKTCQVLQQHGVSVLLCGALSRCWLEHLRGLGIDVHHGLAGDAQAVLRSFLRDGVAGLEIFAMPGRGLAGSGGGHRRFRRRRVFGDLNSITQE